MKIKANNIQAGQTIRFEYGDYDNFVTGQVISVWEDTSYLEMEVMVYGNKQNARFLKNELLEVIS